MYSLNIYTSSNSVSENLCNIWSLILRSGKYNNSDWSKAHVIYNSLFDWIWLWIMCALYQSESTSQIWENLLGLCMWGLFYTGVYAWEGESRGPWTSQSAFLCLLGAGIPDIVVNINELCLKNASQWWILWIFIIRLQEKRGCLPPSDPMKHCKTVRGLETGNLPIQSDHLGKKKVTTVGK